MPRAQKPTGKSRHDPLLVQLNEDQTHAKFGRISQPGKRRKAAQSSDDEEEVPTRCSYRPTLFTR